MADKKITELNSVDLPLVGNEVLPIVQSSVTKKISIAEIIENNILSDYVNGFLKKETSDTGTVINLGYIGGNTCNMSSANTNTTFTLTNIILNGNAEVLINVAIEPTITGATAFINSGFEASTNQIMVVKNYGGTIGVKYYFLTV